MARNGNTDVCIIGRSGSHFTRVARIFAEELAVPYTLAPVYDMASMDPRDYGGNPALKLPVLTTTRGTIFGALNICRALAEIAPVPKRIVWPEAMRDPELINAQELIWHGMQAQVQLAFGTLVAKLPADNLYFAKAAAGLRNGLRWLDRNLEDLRAALPRRDLSVLEVTLFCLVDHLAFRGTLAVESFGTLRGFAGEFRARPSAERTPYRFDALGWD